MEIGVFARTFPSGTLEDNLDAIEDAGIGIVHFNLKCAGMESLPEEIDQDKIQNIRTQFEIRDLVMVAISGTFNMIDPNSERRREMTNRCSQLIEEAPSLGTHVVTLCTGSRDPDDMWCAHPENQSIDAWRDLIETLKVLTPIAEESGVVLGIEPEIANVIDSAPRAKQLLDEIRSPSLGIVLDGANLIHSDQHDQMRVILKDAADLLKDHLIMAHAKDIPSASGSQAAGKGTLDWRAYLKALQSNRFQGPLILHNLSPDEVKSSREFVEATWRECLEERS